MDGVAWGFVGWDVEYVDVFVSWDGFYGLVDPGSYDLGGFDGGSDYEGWRHVYLAGVVWIVLGLVGGFWGMGGAI